jgi:hypothetical protein
MHNIKCRAVARFVLPHAAAGQVYTSKHYACSELNGAIISDVVWKVEVLRMAVSRICIGVGGEDLLILWWAYQSPAQAEVKEYTGEWEEKEMQKQQTNKEQKKSENENL